jgi:hypothetical protein
LYRIEFHARRGIEFILFQNKKRDAMRSLKGIIITTLLIIAVSVSTLTPSIAAGPPPTPGPSANLSAEVAALQAQVAAMRTTFTNFSSAATAKISALQNSNVMAMNPYVSVDTTDDIENATGLKGPHIIFSRANVHIENGEGATGGTINGLGNLIIGYNEPRYDPNTGTSDTSGRGGSHNLIVGPDHKYESYGGFVAGAFNNISGIGSSVSGGTSNTASGFGSSVSGGEENTAGGGWSSVSGGYQNSAGGRGNSPSGYYSSVSGGDGNTASGSNSSVSGGQFIIDYDNNGWAAGTLHSP